MLQNTGKTKKKYVGLGVKTIVIPHNLGNVFPGLSEKTLTLRKPCRIETESVLFHALLSPSHHYSCALGQHD